MTGQQHWVHRIDSVPQQGFYENSGLEFDPFDILHAEGDGYLIFNDYTYWSPVECIPYGVMHAVNELCLDEDWQVAYFALDPYMYCDVAIRRI